MNANLSAVARPNKALDGRQLKKRRRQGKLREIVTRVLQTKEGLPVPKDIIKQPTTRSTTRTFCTWLPGAQSMAMNFVRQTLT
jgi:hypothetical protein